MKVNIYANARIEAMITPEMIEKFRPEAKRLALAIEKKEREAIYGTKQPVKQPRLKF